MRIRIRTYLWWILWVVVGRLIRLLHRFDAWVRWQYVGALTQEAVRRGLVSRKEPIA